jgi:hypothetical protein
MKVKERSPLQFLTNHSGEKTAIVIPIKKYGSKTEQMIRDIQDVLSFCEGASDEKISWSKAKKELSSSRKNK